VQGGPRSTLFTGSSAVAERLARDLRGRLRVEDAGFDWKVLGPDVAHLEYVAWQADQDAYACSGQKCSAQSILFMHQVSATTAIAYSPAEETTAAGPFVLCIPA
jgi:1-pyrroline-5-carboxylate dehydrogenase